MWHCDVASLYPSVMLNYNIFPANDKLGIFHGLLADLRKFRLAAKAGDARRRAAFAGVRTAQLVAERVQGDD